MVLHLFSERFKNLVIARPKVEQSDRSNNYKCQAAAQWEVTLGNAHHEVILLSCYFT